MSLTEEQIKAALYKDVSAKTILVGKEDVEKVIDGYFKDGWELVSQASLNDKCKITFRKVKPAKR